MKRLISLGRELGYKVSAKILGELVNVANINRVSVLFIGLGGSITGRIVWLNKPSERQ